MTLTAFLKQTPLSGPLRFIKRSAVNVLAASSDQVSGLFSAKRMLRFDKFHLGSGPRNLPGWANLDIAGKGNIIWDLRRPLPLAAGSIRYIYTEHFIEHIPRADALVLLKNCRHALGRSGLIRISTPNLRFLCELYIKGELPDASAVGWFPATPCIMVNEAVREWGHLFIYDAEELSALLREAGFTNVSYKAWGESEHAELRGLESRPFYNDLILEASA
jgi:predicted SAM-dependent methyltransferase